MTLTFNITNKRYYWIIETDDSEIVLSPEFTSEEIALEWYNLISEEILSEYGVTDED